MIKKIICVVVVVGCYAATCRLWYEIGHRVGGRAAPTTVVVCFGPVGAPVATPPPRHATGPGWGHQAGL